MTFVELIEERFKVLEGLMTDIKGEVAELKQIVRLGDGLKAKPEPEPTREPLEWRQATDRRWWAHRIGNLGFNIRLTTERVFLPSMESNFGHEMMGPCYPSFAEAAEWCEARR